MSGIRRQQMKLIPNWLRLWINNDVYVARAQSSPETEKPKRKAGGQHKTIDQNMPAFLKKLFNPLLGGGVVRHVREVCQFSSLEAYFAWPALRGVSVVFRSARFQIGRAHV